MKKFILGIFVGALLMVSTAVFAEDGLKKIEAYLRPDLAITLDGNKLVLENNPLIYDGSTYLPLRELATSIGLNVDWNDATQTAELSNKAVIKSDDKKITKTKIDGINAVISDGITYIHLGGIEDKYYDKGYAFKYDVENFVVYLVYNSEKGHPVDKYQIISDAIKPTVFEGNTHITESDYRNIVLPLIK